MRKSGLCVVVPAYNEEKVIGSSLKALKKVVRSRNIFVVSDGSGDKTVSIATSQVKNVMALKKNVGKAQALNKLIKSRKLIKRYKFIMFSDADSRLSRNFLNTIKEEINRNPACIVGTVVSERHGFISAFRTYEYGLTHKIFKQAQNIMQVITVAPGCAAIYRADVLNQLNFTNHTLTEDFDLTIQIHKKKLGRITYVPQAKVITQDPPTLRDYCKQITRWYTGMWQNIFLHRLYIPNKRLNFEIYLLFLDGIAAVASMILALMHPLLFLSMFVIVFISTILLSSFIIILEKQYWALWYSPFFILLYLINLAVYFYSMFRAIISKNRVLSWQKVDRYTT